MQQIGRRRMDMPIKDESLELPFVSEKVMKKAKSLSVESITPDSWYVTGGSEPHVVTKLESWECDCLGFRFSKACSHILAVKISVQSNKSDPAKPAMRLLIC